jgi:DNA-binding transcriptional MerR regulator
VKYNEIRGTMQESAKYAIDNRAHQVALKFRVTLGGQSPTGIRDVLEVLGSEEMWIGDQLPVTRQFVYRLKFDQNEAEWTTGSRNAENKWMKQHRIQYEKNTDKIRVRARRSSFQKQMVVEKANLNKKIERLELRMGEMVRHNKVNAKTVEFWDELEEWNGKFGGAWKVVRLKMGLNLDQIRKALCTWNVKDNAIHKLIDQRNRENEEEEKQQEATAGVANQANNKVEEQQEEEEPRALRKKKDWQQTLKEAVTVARTEVNKTTILNFVKGCFVPKEV